MVCTSFANDQDSIAGAPPANGRQYPPINGASQPSNYPLPSHGDTNGLHSIAPSGSHSRDPSGPRGRVPAPSGMNSSVLQAQPGGPTLSPRSQSSVASNRSPVGLNGPLERRPSLTQNHFRQASKAHGPLAHSRNASFVNSPATSPLSPFIPPPNGASAVPEFSSLTMHHHGNPDSRPSEPPSSTSNSMHNPTSTLSAGQDGSESSNTVLTQKRLERSGGNPIRRGHSHHRSQTKHPHSHEQKTVNEWTLHHLFNSVSQPPVCWGIRLRGYSSLHKQITRSSNVC